MTKYSITQLKDICQGPKMMQSLAEISTSLVPAKIGAAAYLTLCKNPELQACSPESIVLAVKTLAQLDCMPDGIHGWLIKYGSECIPMPSARGLMRCALKTGAVSNITCEIIREKDEIEWEIRDGALTYRHRFPVLSRGPVVGAYCSWEMSGVLHGVMMTKEEIDEVKNCSKAAYSKNSPWTRFYDQMALKAVIKRAAKQFPLPDEIIQTMADADRKEFEFNKELSPEAQDEPKVYRRHLPTLDSEPEDVTMSFSDLTDSDVLEDEEEPRTTKLYMPVD